MPLSTFVTHVPDGNVTEALLWSVLLVHEQLNGLELDPLIVMIRGPENTAMVSVGNRQEAYLHLGGLSDETRQRIARSPATPASAPPGTRSAWIIRQVPTATSLTGESAEASYFTPTADVMEHAREQASAYLNRRLQRLSGARP